MKLLRSVVRLMLGVLILGLPFSAVAAIVTITESAPQAIGQFTGYLLVIAILVVMDRFISRRVQHEKAI